MNQQERDFKRFVRLRVIKFEGIIEQHLNACGGEIGEVDISDYFQTEIKEIIKIINNHDTKK